MPTRRFHSKSRNGCQQCKTSRIKCDEARPTCKQCARRCFRCDYSAFRHLRSVHRPTAQSLAGLGRNPAKMPVPHLVFDPQPNNLHATLYREVNICHAYESDLLSPQGEATGFARKKFELRLIHAFISMVAPVQASMSTAGISPDSTTNIPLLAMKYVYARDIILGCSALYLRTSNPTDISLVEASHEYTVRAIAECSRQIQTGVHQGNAEGLFFTSMFVAKHALGSRQYDHQTKGNALCKRDALPILQWLRQFRGIKAVLDAGWAWISPNKHLSSMLYALTVLDITTQGYENTNLRILLEDLDETSTCSASVEAYKVAVGYLISVTRNPNLHGLVGFILAVPDRFFKLLEEQDPRAMVIVGWYLALSVVSSRSGVLMLAAKQEYSMIVQQLPTEWLPKMELAGYMIEHSNIK